MSRGVQQSWLRSAVLKRVFWSFLFFLLPCSSASVLGLALGGLEAPAPVLGARVLELLLPLLAPDEGVQQSGHVVVLGLHRLPTALLHVPAGGGGGE